MYQVSGILFRVQGFQGAVIVPYSIETDSPEPGDLAQGEVVFLNDEESKSIQIGMRADDNTDQDFTLVLSLGRKLSFQYLPRD
jgi:hypothetical protein